jgi:hypothetical protein
MSEKEREDRDASKAIRDVFWWDHTPYAIMPRPMEQFYPYSFTDQLRPIKPWRENYVPPPRGKVPQQNNPKHWRKK